MNSEERENNPEIVEKDRSVLYMAGILGFVIIVMAYLTLFGDDLWGGSQKQNIVTVVGDQSKLLNQNESLSNEELASSLTKFIQAFYYDQKKGYFDPPSYFAPITKTFYNFHNLTYESLKDLYWRRLEDMKNLDRNWIVSTLDYQRTDSGIVATYWAREHYFRPSVNQQQSAQVKYEMIIDKDGKIYSFKEAEVKNFQAVTMSGDSATFAFPLSPADNSPVAPVKDSKTYDVTMVDPIPQFPGGPAQLSRYLQTNLHYPPQAKEKKIQGNVYVSFFIEKDGSLRNIEIKQGIGNGCDEEALRLVRSFPTWIPGMLNGAAVTTYYVLSIPFQIN